MAANGIVLHMSGFLKGALIGFSIAAPVGPIGVLCIRRSLADGVLIGLATGLGAATADAVYGGVAGFGLTAVSSLLQRQQFLLRLVGGIFLCYLGIITFFTPPAEKPTESRRTGLLFAYLTTFLLTLSNPTTVASFLVIFAGFGLGAAADYGAATLLILGVFTGSALWWLLLSASVGILRTRITPAWMRAVNRFSGCLILGFGLYFLTLLFLQDTKPAT
jgi:threonine/homoserine/homoserine lactone efflux protein